MSKQEEVINIGDMKKSYSVEIFLLNYNGLHFIEPCLKSISLMNTNDIEFGITLIDNSSNNFSPNQIISICPENLKENLTIIPLDKNYGFAKGHNLGIKKRLSMFDSSSSKRKKPEFIILLNTDTEVTENWLVENIRTINQDQKISNKIIQCEKIGAVSSKAIFKDKFIGVCIQSPLYKPSDLGIQDNRDLGVFLLDIEKEENILMESSRFKFKGAYAKEGHGRWLSPESTIYIPVRDNKYQSSFDLTLENHNPNIKNLDISISILGSNIVRKISIPQARRVSTSFNLGPSSYQDIIQNAGCFVTDKFEAGDIGFLEENKNSNKELKTVDAVCGVSLLTRTSLWEKLKGFDEMYFSYFEDVDYSIRLKKLGFYCIHNPEAIIRHVHCGSGVENSEYFNINVSWSRLVFKSKFANSKIWKETISEYKRIASRELDKYILDKTLFGKATLRTISRYYKNYFYFFKNRLFSEAA